MAEQRQKEMTGAFVALASVSLVLLLIMISIYCWGIDRGLDLIDEGDFLLSSTNPAAYPQPSSYAFFMARLPLLLSEPILNFRLTSIVTQLSSMSILSYAFSTWLAHYVDLTARRWQKASITIITIMSSLLFATIFSPTIAYNLFASFFIVLSAACLFFALAGADGTGLPGADNHVVQKENTSSYTGFRMALPMVAAGVLLGLSFFAKFTSCICFYFLTIAMVMLSFKQWRLRFLAWHLGGVVLGFIGYFCTIENVSSWWARIKVTVIELELSSGSSHSPSQVFANSTTSAVKHLPELLTLLMACSVLLILWRFAAKRLQKNFALLIPFAALLLMIAFWTWRAITQHELHLSLVYWPIVLITLSVLTTLAATGFQKTLPDKVLKRRILPGFALLGLLPFALSFGTNAPILWHAIGNIAPLFLGVGYLSVLIGPELDSVFFPLTSLCLMSIVSFVAFINGYVLHYRNSSPLFLNTVCLAAPARVHRIKLEPTLAAFIGQGYAVLSAHGFKESDPIVAIYDLPGFVWAVGGTSPMFARYGQPFTVQNDFFLSRLPQKKWDRLFLIVNGSSGSAIPDDYVCKHLRRAGLEFPARFELIGKVYRPNQYWNGGTLAYFYALKPE